jgi:hypothetical protein
MKVAETETAPLPLGVSLGDPLALPLPLAEERAEAAPLALPMEGVGDAVWTGDDTRTDAARFYSNRRAYLNGEADFGRLMSAISLD